MILVLGPARTGTSLTAGILSKLGFSLGELFEAPDDWNPQGNFVDADLSRLNKYLYQGERLIGGAYKPQSDPMWMTWREMIACRQAIKDHALLPLLDHFMEVVNPSTLKVILTNRDENDSVNSLAARRFDHDRSVAIQFQNDCRTLIANFQSRYRPAALSLEFREAFAEPATYARKIAEFVGVPCTQEAIDFISPDLKRF